MKPFLEAVEFVILALLIGLAAAVVVGACAATVPFRWMLEDRRRLKAEGDRFNS